MTTFNETPAASLSRQATSILDPEASTSSSSDGITKDSASAIATNWLSKQNVRDLQQQMVMTMLDKNIAFTPAAVSLLGALRTASSATNFAPESATKMVSKADVLKDIAKQMGLSEPEQNGAYKAIAAALPSTVTSTLATAIKEKVAASPDAKLPSEIRFPMGGVVKTPFSLEKFTSEVNQMVADGAPKATVGETMMQKFMANFTKALDDGQVSATEATNLSAQLFAMVGKYDSISSSASSLGRFAADAGTNDENPGATPTFGKITPKSNATTGTAAAPAQPPYDWLASGAAIVRSDGTNVFVDKRVWDTNSTFSPKNVVFSEIPHLFNKTASGALDIKFAKAADGTDWVVLPSGANTDFVLSAINSSAKNVVAQVKQTQMTLNSASTSVSEAPSEPDWVSKLAGSTSRGVNANFRPDGSIASAEQIRQGYLDRSGGFA